MLTSYLVKCPHPDCNWFGSLLPKADPAWHSAAPVGGVVVFECPQCQRQWLARIAGDDVVPLPLEQGTGAERREASELLAPRP